MANLNKVMLIGRLTKDPEVRTFQNGGKVAHIRFAVSNRKKNQQTGAWEDDPCYLDLKAFNRGEEGGPGRKLADLCGSLRKGQQVFFEGHLVWEEWEDKNGGGKRQAVKVVVDDLQFLEPKQQDGGGGSQRSSQPAPRRAEAGYPSGGGSNYNDEPEPEPARDEDGIPF
jgi:single-strand DNA-binding protein